MPLKASASLRNGAEQRKKHSFAVISKRYSISQSARHLILRDARFRRAPQDEDHFTGGLHEISGDAADRTIPAAVAGIRRGRGLSEQADQADRAVSGRRPERHYRARGRSAHVGARQAAGADRQSRRTRRRAWSRRGGESEP